MTTLQKTIAAALQNAWNESQKTTSFHQFMDNAGDDILVDLIETYKKHSVDFIEWESELTPSGKVTVHAPAGSGMGNGVYDLTSEQLYDKFLATQK